VLRPRHGTGCDFGKRGGVWRRDGLRGGQGGTECAVTSEGEGRKLARQPVLRE